MKGMVIKDLMSAKTILLIYILITLFAGIITGEYLVSQATIFFYGGIIMHVMSLDEKTGWEKWAVSMPVSRKELIWSKYISCLLFLLIGVVSVLLGNFIFSWILHQDLPVEVFKNIFHIFLISVIYISFVIPFGLKFGERIGRMLMFIAIFLIVPLMRGKIFGLISMTSFHKNLFLWALFITGIIFISSLVVSVKIYEKKDLC